MGSLRTQSGQLLASAFEPGRAGHIGLSAAYEAATFSVLAQAASPVALLSSIVGAMPCGSIPEPAM